MNNKTLKLMLPINGNHNVTFKYSAGLKPKCPFPNKETATSIKVTTARRIIPQ